MIPSHNAESSIPLQQLFDNRKERKFETALGSEPLLTVAQLAARLNVSKSWVYKRTKELPSYGAGRSLRFDWAEVISFLRKE